MKKEYLAIVLTGFACCFLDFCFSQDCKIYKEANYGGVAIDLSIGDSTLISGSNDNLSFKTFNDAAILIKAAEPVASEVENWSGIYHSLFFYSQETERPGIVGTDQWTNGHYSSWAHCVNKFTPEPPIYIPIDPPNAHPASGRHRIELPIPGKEYVFLKRAFFWENGEQLNCELDAFTFDPHGAAGAIKINICHPDILQFPPWVLETNPHLWKIPHDCEVHCNEISPYTNCHISPNSSVYHICEYYNWQTEIVLNKLLYKTYTLLGPNYFSPSACNGSALGVSDEYAPSPHSEWIDGPWGAFYNNFPLIDWQETDFENLDQLAILISEADKEEFWGFSTGNFEDVLGYGALNKNDNAPILLSIGMSGWLLLEKQLANPVESVERTDFYWYPTQSIPNPELILGPLPRNTLGKHLFIEGDSLFIGCDDNNNGLCYLLYQKNQQKIIKNFIHNEALSLFPLKKYIQTDVNQIPIDTFFRYQACYNNVCPPFALIDTSYYYVNHAITDTIYIEGYRFQNPPESPLLQFSIIAHPNMNPTSSDTVAGTFSYRAKGSQYNPYKTYNEVEQFVPSKDSVAVYAGIIPPGNYLSKEMTYVPLDKYYKQDKAILTQSIPANNINVSYQRKEVHSEDNLFVYPNPVFESTNLYLKCENSTNGVLILTNQYGQILKTIKNGEFEKGVHNFSIRREELTQGLNFITFTSEERMITQKIIVPE